MYRMYMYVVSFSINFVINLGSRGCCEDGRGSLQCRVSEDRDEILQGVGGQTVQLQCWGLFHTGRQGVLGIDLPLS